MSGQPGLSWEGNGRRDTPDWRPITALLHVMLGPRFTHTSRDTPDWRPVAALLHVMLGPRFTHTSLPHLPAPTTVYEVAKTDYRL
ncbi:hypothetical protein ACOMHN_012256 [Nucella lapillus]